MAYRPKEPRPDPAIPGLTPHQVAVLLGISTQTLAHWRVRGCGPRYVRVSSRCIRYMEDDVRAWLEQRAQNSTAENGGK